MRTLARSRSVSAIGFAILAHVPSSACADSDPTAPPGDWTVTGSAAVASQYRFRGIALSDNHPVAQGAVTVAHASGFYASAWGSSALAKDSPVTVGGSEIDISGGYTHVIGTSGISYDAGLSGYVYPGASNRNFFEIHGSLSETLGSITAKVGTAVAPAQKEFSYDWTSPSRTNVYVYGDLSGAIPQTPISLHSHIAHSGGGFDYARAYVEYSVGATVKWKSLALDASLVGTTISHADFATGGAAANGVGAPGPLRLEAFYRTGKPVGVISLTASF